MNHKSLEVIDEEDEESGDLFGQFPVRVEVLLSSLKRCFIEGEYTCGSSRHAL